MKDSLTIFLVSLGVGLFLGISLTILVWPDLILIGYVGVFTVAVIIGPVTFYTYAEQRRIQDMEKHFPAFLQQLSEGKRAGLNMAQAIMNSSETNHGSLTKEIKKMNNQLSWGVPVPKVLRMFQKRTKKSQYINRAMAIILESYSSGGNVANTMEAISHSISSLKEVEAEKENVLKEQVVIIYAIHFIFVGIIIAMYKIMLPLLAAQQTPGAGLFSATANAPDTSYFKMLFFLTLTIQSVSNGVVAGEAKENSLSASIKHVIIMLSASIIGYTTFILPKQINLTVNLRDNEAIAGAEFELFGFLEEEGKRITDANIIASLAGTETVTSTGENGDFEASIRAPRIPGVYVLSVSAVYGRNEKTVEKQVFVTE